MRALSTLPRPRILLQWSESPGARKKSDWPRQPTCKRRVPAFRRPAARALTPTAEDWGPSANMSVPYLGGSEGAAGPRSERVACSDAWGSQMKGRRDGSAEQSAANRAGVCRPGYRPGAPGTTRARSSLRVCRSHCPHTPGRQVVSVCSLAPFRRTNLGAVRRGRAEVAAGWLQTSSTDSRSPMICDTSGLASDLGASEYLYLYGLRHVLIYLYVPVRLWAFSSFVTSCLPEAGAFSCRSPLQKPTGASASRGRGPFCLMHATHPLKCPPCHQQSITFSR